MVAALFTMVFEFWLQKTLELAPPISQINTESQTFKDRLRARFSNPCRERYTFDCALLCSASVLMQMAHSAAAHAHVEASYLDHSEHAREISIALKLVATSIFLAYYTVMLLALIAFVDEFRKEPTID